MAKKSKPLNMSAGNVDLTPMIDCVFLLIIFFMTVTELKKTDTIRLKLPDAESALSEEDSKFIINIEEYGDITTGGRKRSIDELKVFLMDKYNHLDQDKELEAATPTDKRRFASVMVKIRADELTEFRDVQAVLAACVEAKFYKTSFGALAPEIK